jgi:hypothetical protein
MAWVAPSVQSSGTTFAQFQAGGASRILENLITQQASYYPTSSPSTTATLSAGGTGNTLAAGTYYVVITETNGWGETTANPVSASQAVTSGQSMVVTFPSLQTKNVARNVYLGSASAGPFALYATGVTASSFACTTAAPSAGAGGSYAVAPPTANTTGLSYTDANGNVLNGPYSLIRSAKDGNLEDVYRAIRTLAQQFLQGEPAVFSGIVQKHRHYAAAIAVLNQLCTEIGTLIDANPGTLSLTSTGIGGEKTHRTWP